MKKPCVAPYEGGELAFMGGTIQGFIHNCSETYGRYVPLTSKKSVRLSGKTSPEETAIRNVEKQL
jgi:hypothetical protein